MMLPYLDTFAPMPTPPSILTQAYDYWVDRSQRNVLFWNALRKRGNEYFNHYKLGQPPVLVFDYEMVMDGRTFDQPVNYSLLRILNRRPKGFQASQNEYDDRQQTLHGKTVDQQGRPCRPIVIMDPRAGHGPGIGGSKLNSQIGVALDYGHPVYFVMFYTNPEPGQSIALIEQAEVRFLKEVARRHPDAPKPAVIANCQAGWAAALIGADRPDVTGPLVLNGSPLSYWGGTKGANPMRYRGGLLGGVWLTSLLCDLGNGWFDGAHLVAGFEDLNPANTYWTKHYHLFANIDTEEKRFLDFEKWWGGFFKMTAEEIHFIVDSLFIGNELEQGNLKLDDNKVVNLKNIEKPILVFASGGDNITPPQQALNWIFKVYGTVDEIKRCGQVIVYMVHENIGHLGIFVSGKVALKEHKQILGNIGWLEYLAPGLYEMVIKKDKKTSKDQAEVSFERREMEDIIDRSQHFKDEKAFLPVNSISRFNDFIYRTFISQWVKLAAKPPLDSWIRMLHPLRMQRYMISDHNLACLPVKYTAASVKAQRRTVSEENIFVGMENIFSDSMKIGLNYYRDMRDTMQEFVFESLFGNPWLQWMLGAGIPYAAPKVPPIEKKKKRLRKENKKFRRKADKGGYVEAFVRVLIALLGVNDKMNARKLDLAEEAIQQDRMLRSVTPDAYKKIIKEQALILDADLKRALASIKLMVPSQAHRKKILALAKAIISGDRQKPGKKEIALLVSIEEALMLNNEPCEG